MALPKSTYVMGVLTLGLFGLAIRQTAAGKATSHDDRDDTIVRSDDGDNDDSDDERAVRDYERMESERVAAEREADLKKQKAVETTTAEMKKLYGAEAASMGSLFIGVALDADYDSMPKATDDAIETFRTKTHSGVTLGMGGVLDRIDVEIGSEEDEGRSDVCEGLGKQLTTAWGSGTVGNDYDTRIWLNPATKQRVTYNTDRCALSFEHYAKPEDWITRTATSIIPIDMVGMSATKAAARVKSEVYDNSFEWRRWGIGTGTTQTNLTATVRNNVVTGIAASTRVTQETWDTLEAALTKTFGAPKREQDGDNVDLTFKRPQMAISFDGRIVTVTLGKF